MPSEVLGNRDIFKKDNWDEFKEIIEDWSHYVLNVQPKSIIGWKADRYFKSQNTLSSSFSNQAAQLSSAATNIGGQNNHDDVKLKRKENISTGNIDDQERKPPARPSYPGPNQCATSEDSRYFECQQSLSSSSIKQVTQVTLSAANIDGQNNHEDLDHKMEENISTENIADQDRKLPARPNIPSSNLCATS